MTDLTKIVIPFIQAEWETIGYMLHCDIHTIIAIGEKYSNNPSKCCREVLKDWLTSDRGVHSKTWSTLLNVIGQLPELADVKKKIITRLHKLQL